MLVTPFNTKIQIQNIKNWIKKS